VNPHLPRADPDPGGDRGGLDAAVVGAYLSGRIGLREAAGLDEGDLHALRRLGEARTVFEGLVEVDGDSAWAHAALGSAYQSLALVDEAIAEYDEALRLDPGERTARVNRGELLLTSGRADEGIDDLATAIRADPDAADAQANRARALLVATRQILEAAVA
jgi:tetratricopeptide (TPR) repeat protein